MKKTSTQPKDIADHCVKAMYKSRMIRSVNLLNCLLKLTRQRQKLYAARGDDWNGWKRIAEMLASQTGLKAAPQPLPKPFKEYPDFGRRLNSRLIARWLWATAPGAVADLLHHLLDTIASRDAQTFLDLAKQIQSALPKEPLRAAVDPVTVALVGAALSDPRLLDRDVSTDELRAMITLHGHRSVSDRSVLRKAKALGFKIRPPGQH